MARSSSATKTSRGSESKKVHPLWPVPSTPELGRDWRPRILVVDDEPPICRALRRFLRMDGFEVLEAHSGRAALKLLAEHEEEVQVIISDLNMPGGMDGIEFLRTVRDEYPRARRILLTAFGDLNLMERAINESGVHRFMPKPWDSEVMRTTIKESVEQWQALNEREEMAALVKRQRDALEGLTEELKEQVSRRTELLENVTRRWRQTLDSINDPLTLIDRDYRIQRANKAAARWAGADIRALNGQKCHRVLFGHESPCSGCPMGRTDEALRDAEEAVEIADARTGQLWAVSSWPLDAEMDSEMGQYVCHYRDITASKALERRVIMSEKMAAVGELSGCVAHELNNPLTGILSFSQILGRKVRDDDKLAGMTRDIEEQARRCKHIVQSLLDFARPGATPASKSAIDLHDLIENCAYMANLKGGVVFNFEGPEDLWPVWGNSDSLKSVFLNLFNNAVHAMEGAGKVQGQIRVVADNHSARPGEGRTVHLRVMDDGPGIPTTLREQVFAPFFTTKAENKSGTGLGLSIVKNVIEDHGGSVNLIDGPSGGACFDIKLPTRT
ncbi:MAG: response regulator [Bradymonadia bacterium]